MYQNIKGVIFDLDGTLVDSMWVWSKIDVDFINKRAVDVSPDEIMKDVAHYSFVEVAQYFKDRFNMTESIEEIMQEWNDAALVEYSENVKLKSGVLDLLKILKKNNIKTAIATSNSHKLLKTAVEANGISDYFDVYVTTDDAGAKSKIDPDVYLYAAGKIGVAPEECVVFEDVPSAMEGARKAGMKVIGVNDRYTIIEEDRKNELCSHFIEDFCDIHHLFIRTENETLELK